MKNKTHIQHAIKAAAAEDMTKFESTVTSLISAKLLDAIESRKPAVAQKLFKESQDD